MLKSKNIAMLGLLIVCVAVWFLNIEYYREHKADIILQVSDVVERIALPYKIARLATMPADEVLAIPVRGITLSDIEDTYGSPRPDDREHEGIDVFAPTGTRVYPVAPGYVVQKDTGGLGGNHLFIVGAGGKRYYYAHFNHFPVGIEVGTFVTLDTVIGYVGTTGNASSTPPHLHFGMYGLHPENPYGLLVERDEI